MISRGCGWVAYATVALCACGGETHESRGLGSETNWLQSCETGADCSVGTCVCGLCSVGCGDDAECPDGLRCQLRDSALYASACAATSAVRGLCAPECERDDDCGAGRACDAGTCIPVWMTSGDGGAAEGGASASPEPSVGVSGEEVLIVDAHVDLTAECLPQLEKPIGSGAGMFDIAPSGHDEPIEGGVCDRPYMLTLRVANPSSELVPIISAEVRLMSVENQRIEFNRSGNLLANPFLVTATGSVPAAAAGAYGESAILVETIPADYAQQLDGFIDGQVLVAVQLHGVTQADDHVFSNTFVYALGICHGCLTMCLTELTASGATIDELNPAACIDNTGADGRYCIDPDC